MKIICFPFYHELLQTTKVNLTKKLSHTMHRKDLNNKNKVYNIKYKVIHKQLQQTCLIPYRQPNVMVACLRACEALYSCINIF